MDARYKAVMKERGEDFPCPLCASVPLKEFTHWKLLENDFPYDRVTVVHHMLLPKRHVSEPELTEEEREEYASLKRGYIAEHYEMLFEGTPKQRSVPEHFHIHVTVLNTE